MADLTYNEELLRAMVRHQVGILRFSGGLRNRVWEILDATEADLREQIANRLRRDIGKPRTPARLRRLEVLFAGLRETRATAWKQVRKVWIDELRELSAAEAGFAAGTIQSIAGVELGLGLPDPIRLRSIATEEPFMGAVLKDWAQKIEVDDIARIQQQIRIGLTQGETIPQISRRVVGTVSKRGADGATAVTRRNAEAITRTASSSVASAARRELYAENQELFTEELFTATLDSRTTPICRSLDGKTFKPGTAPVLPLHWNERSVLSPVLDGVILGERPTRNFTEQQLLREYSGQKGFKAPRDRKGLPQGTRGDFDRFKRQRIRELTGRAPAKTSYQEWLKGQDAQFQRDILGPTRAKLFRQGGLTLDRFVLPDGSELSLSQLAQSYGEAFKRAGLDPSKFIKGAA